MSPDEIERLRANNAGLSKAVINIQEERDLAQAEFRAYHKAWEEGAARIQELEGTVAALREIAVEDRAKQIYPYTMPTVGKFTRRRI